MQKEDRLIHFSTELMHAPLRHEAQALQRLYYELSQERGVGYDSTDLGGPAPPRFYSKRGEKTQSFALFLPDRVALAEEWVDIPLSEFLHKLKGVGERVCSCLNVPLFLAQTVTLRSTFALTHYEDARVFLMDHMCAQQDRISPFFQRPIGTCGLRFVLPATPEHKGIYNIAVESFRFSRNEVLVEVHTVFPKTACRPEELSDAQDRVREVHAYIQKNIFPFLDQYDQPVV